MFTYRRWFRSTGHPYIFPQTALSGENHEGKIRVTNPTDRLRGFLVGRGTGLADPPLLLAMFMGVETLERHAT